jgi:outer membrane protein
MKARHISKARPYACLAGIAGLAFASAAGAQERSAGDVFVRAGAASVMFDSSADFSVAGQAVPGGNLKARNNVTVAIEGEYLVTDRIGLSLTIGIPPKSEIVAKGSLAPFGTLGEVRYGTGVILAKYHFDNVGPFQPWVGVGAARFVVMDSDGEAIPDLKVKDAWAAAFQVGADYPVTDRLSLYGSVSKMILETEGNGSFGPFPVKADVTLDPTIVQGGLAVRF